MLHLDKKFGTKNIELPNLRTSPKYVIINKRKFNNENTYYQQINNIAIKLSKIKTIYYLISR